MGTVQCDAIDLDFHGGSHSEGPGVFQLTVEVKFMGRESPSRAAFLFQSHGRPKVD